MYYPYFRGKQYELVMLREMAEEMAASNITPIIEPVKENTASLMKCIKELIKYSVPFIFIINPRHGDFKTNNLKLIDDVLPEFEDYSNLQIGYVLDSNSELSSIRAELKALSDEDKEVALIHYGFPDGTAIAEVIQSKNIPIKTNIFIDNYFRQRYRKSVEAISENNILIKDGFRKTKNADYVDNEPFSELHLIYDEDGFDGFGDFSIVGDEYSEGGGPAYAVAIHITYLNKDNDIDICHYISDRRDSPVDPAGKFAEALTKLVYDIEEEDTKILVTKAIEEFKELDNEGRYPGLGYLKKLSMKHHMELIIYLLNN